MNRKHKSITIHPNKVEFQNNNFRVTTEVTDSRDINGCIARALEHAKDANLTGLIIDDTRVARS
jgi:hypothetical protein